MARDMQTKWGATPFDPTDPNDAVGESARKAVLDAFANVKADVDGADRAGEYLLGGMLVGVVQVMQASLDADGEQFDAQIRASLMQIAPWAVDMARSAQDRPPLADT